MAMNNDVFRQLVEVFDFPIYVFKKAELGFRCDKLDLVDREAKDFDTTTYLITGTRQCTCMSWMKAERCKHLQMVKGEADWNPLACAADLAVGEAERLVEVAGDVFPESSKLWVPDPATVPDPVAVLEFKVKEKGPRDVDRICSLKTFDRSNKLGVTLKFV